MTNEPIIMSEWQWAPAARPSPQHTIYEQLIWRGMVLGALEAFRESGPFYGNIGTGRAPLDYRYRTGPAGDLDSCRKRVEANVLRALHAGTQEGEPVAWLHHKIDGDGFTTCDEDDDGAFAVYTAAPPAPSVAVPSPPQDDVREAFQSRVRPWMLECFGPVIPFDKTERNHRFLEEALELVQSNGCTQSEAHQLVDYVFGRDQGDINQEVGSVMVTLAALCLANGVDMHNAGEIELARIWENVDQIRAKQAAKPKHSPLPIAMDDRQTDYVRHGLREEDLP